MKYSEFLKSIQSKTIQPVITFLGEEYFLKGQALDTVIGKFLDAQSRRYNYRSYSGEELKDSSFLEEAGTVPMFAETKIIYVKNAAVMDKNLGRFKDSLQRYLERPSPETILIFDLDKWEGRSKLKAVLAPHSAIVEFNPLSERELPSWITTHLKTLNFQIDPAALQALTERTGVDLQKVASELEKLMLLKNQEKRIALEDVEKSVGQYPIATIWEWTDAIMDQKAHHAVELLNSLLELGEEPIKCVGILAKQYEKMILTKELVSQRVAEAVIAQKIGKPAYYLRPYLNQLSKFSMDDLLRAIWILSTTDKALKSSQAHGETVLHIMTVQLCSLKSVTKPVFDVPLQ